MGPAAANEAPVAVLSIDAQPGEDAAPAARWEASGARADGGYRMSLSRGALDVGAYFEPRVPAARSLDARFDNAAPVGSMLPAISFGLRRVSAGPATASSLVQRALGAGTGVPYESKVGIEWKPAQSQIFLNHGVGVRLSGDDRVTMRLRKGSLGIYLKRNF